MWIFIHCKDLWWIHRFWLRLKYLFIENCLLKLTCLNFGAIVVNFLYVVLHAFLFVEAVFYFVWIRHIDSTSSWCGGCILKTFNFSFFKFSWKFKTYLLSTTVELLLRIGISIFINFKNFTNVESVLSCNIWRSSDNSCTPLRVRYVVVCACTEHRIFAWMTWWNENMKTLNKCEYVLTVTVLYLNDMYLTIFKYNKVTFTLKILRFLQIWAQGQINNLTHWSLQLDTCLFDSEWSECESSHDMCCVHSTFNTVYFLCLCRVMMIKLKSLFI